MFYQDGYQAVGIDAIPADVGVAKMTLYNHFASKYELIIAVLEKRHLDFIGTLEMTVEAAGRAPMKRLMAVFAWPEQWLESATFNGCAFIRAVAEYPRPDEKPHQVAAAHKQSVIDLLSPLCRETELNERASVGRQLALLVEGAIVTTHTFGPGRVAKDTRDAGRRLLARAEGKYTTGLLGRWVRSVRAGDGTEKANLISRIVSAISIRRLSPTV